MAEPVSSRVHPLEFCKEEDIMWIDNAVSFTRGAFNDVRVYFAILPNEPVEVMVGLIELTKEGYKGHRGDRLMPDSSQNPYWQAGPEHELYFDNINDAHEEMMGSLTGKGESQ